MSGPSPLHVIVDRDGVLNVEGAVPVREPAQWRWERGASEGLALLAGVRARVSVVTNQAAVGRGEIGIDDVEHLHRWLAHRLVERGVRLVGIFACPHAAAAGCGCRKPAPGLVEAAVRASGVAPAATVLVGDDLRDLAAASAGGVEGWLVRTGKGAAVEPEVPPGVRRFDDLAGAASAIVAVHAAQVG